VALVTAAAGPAGPSAATVAAVKAVIALPPFSYRIGSVTLKVLSTGKSPVGRFLLSRTRRVV
jgi:hypothetical protein